MSKLMISFLLAIGCSAWIFNQLQNRSGRNTRQSLSATAISGLLIFIFALSALNIIF